MGLGEGRVWVVGREGEVRMYGREFGWGKGRGEQGLCALINFP